MFKLKSTYKPTGDQPEAIKSIVNNLKQNIRNQCLKGVTGSGKTFTIANVIESHNRPTLILCHNKTLAAQLYTEFKTFFPDNLIEYFVSYYDYYQPEAYLPTTNTYIEKDLSINSEIEKFRLHTTTSLLSGRNDIVVISSVSCIYGLGNPIFFKEKTIEIYIGQIYERQKIKSDLINGLYTRTNDTNVARGQFKFLGDILMIQPSSEDVQYKIHFWGNEIENIEIINIPNSKKNTVDKLKITPANIFITSTNNKQRAINEIKKELTSQINYFTQKNQHEEANRIQERVNFDLEMINELGYCSGIENYARYFDGRKQNTRPFCLLDYFPKDFLLVIDESHVTIPQIKAMHGGDQARKKTLVEYGFRLPSALDNRPLSFVEFENIKKQIIFVSATPGNYEYDVISNNITEQIIRPTGLLEPKIILRPCKNQIDNLIEEINSRISKNQRVLVTTLTKKMAEKLILYLRDIDIKSTYIHSDIDTLERVAIMKNLRLGNVDVLIGVNLLREGLDLPEVSLVAIMDADKEGFLRSKKSLIQTIGRAARHIDGTSILYGDNTTDAMRHTIQETNHKRKIQQKYNAIHNITPKPLNKQVSLHLMKTNKNHQINNNIDECKNLNNLSIEEIKKEIKSTKKLMNNAAISMNFQDAIKHRDHMFSLQERLKKIS